MSSICGSEFKEDEDHQESTAQVWICKNQNTSAVFHIEIEVLWVQQNYSGV